MWYCCHALQAFLMLQTTPTRIFMCTKINTIQLMFELSRSYSEAWSACCPVVPEAKVRLPCGLPSLSCLTTINSFAKQSMRSC